MRNISPALLALLNAGGPYYPADLYTFTLIDGTVVRYANYDINLTYGGNTFSCNAPRFKRSKIRYVIGLQVDTLDLSILADPSLTIGTQGQGWAAAAQSGTLDGAVVQLDQVFMSTPGTVVGGYIHFLGTMADLTAGRTSIEAKINSYLDLLNVQMPRNLFQPGCIHTLYDSGCGINRNSYSASGTVSDGSTTLSVITNASVTSNYCAGGYITITSGALSGTKRTVRSNSGGTFTLLSPLASAPVAGVTLTAFAGCDKQVQTCNAKFNNIANFKGMPFIPVAETAL